MQFGETRSLSFTVLVSLAAACGTDPTNVPPGGGGVGGATAGATTGGSSASGATSGGAAGTSGAGGATTAGAGMGGASAAGATSAGMGGSVGGTPAGGNAGAGASTSGGSGAMAGGGAAGGAGAGAGGIAGSGAGAGNAGTAGGGVSGMSAGGSGGSSSNGVMPSEGCGKSSGVPMNVSVPNGIVTFPDGYDGSTPVPMMFGFHGAGRTNEEFHEVDARTQNSALEQNFVMVYIKSAGSGWTASDKSRLDTAYDQLTTDHCIDTNRVFATGHSSGAYFIETLLCDGEQRFKGVVMVAGSRVCDSWDALPSMLIHGENDQERVSQGDANGQQELGPFVASNTCGAATTPYAGAMSCNSMYNQAAVDNGCVAYEGCAAPFVFCSHDDQNYSGTNHGWPCFANQTMYTFLSSL